MPLLPFADPENFQLPATSCALSTCSSRRGDREPWTHLLGLEQEQEILPKADLDDGTLAYR